MLDDQVAVPLLGPEARAELEAAKEDPTDANDLKVRGNRMLRAWLVARSRYAEDKLGMAVAAGVQQYVLLGAGLDTFAHRNPYPELRVFEIDHPATQAWKQQLVSAAQLAAPANHAYVAVDFEIDDMRLRLEESGFDREAPAVFAWLGVVPYLTLPAFRATLGYIAGRPRGSGLIFDYGQPRWVLPRRERIARDLFAARVKRVGEPFQLHFTPGEAARELAGFRELEDLGAAELNDLYFNQRLDGLRLAGASGRLLSAWL